MLPWRGKAWILLTLVIAGFFWRPLFTETFFFRDLHFLHFAKKLLLLDAIRARELPLWDPLSQSGQPFLADPQSTLFYPSNLFYLVLEPVAAFNAAIILQFLLCALGAYWLARVLRLSHAAAFVAGSFFALCGYTLSTANLLLPLLGLPWLPIAIASYERFRESGHARWFIAAAFAGALPVFGGAPEIALIAYATLGCWILVSGSGRRDPRALHRRRLLHAFLLFSAILGIALIQIVPTIEMIRESSRSKGVPLEESGGWSVDARRIPELVVPEFFGPTDRLREDSYWGRNFEDDGFPYILSIYFGFPAILLSFAGALSASSPLSGRIRWLLFVLVAVGALIAAGRHTPLFELIRRLPLLTVFRFPVKAIALAILPSALLAAAGADSLRVDAVSLSRLRLAAWVAAASIGALGAAILWSDGFASGFQELFFRVPELWVSRLLAARIFHAAAAAAAFALVLTLGRTRSRLIPALAAVVVTADLAIAGTSVNNYAPRTFFDEPATVSAVRKSAGDGRLYRAPNPAEFSLVAPTDDNVWLARWNLQVLTDYTGLLFRIPLVFHQDFGALGPYRVVELGKIVDSLPWAKRFGILQASGCGSALTADLLRSRRPDVVLTNASRRPFFAYRVGGGRAWFTSDVTVAGDRATLHAMRTDGTKRLPLFVAPPAAGVSPCAGGSAALRMMSRNALRLDVQAPCDGYVAVAQSYYPDWSATVDGREAPIRRANYAFTCVYVEAGPHVVELAYRPRSVKAGAFGTALTVLLLAAYPLVRTTVRGPAPEGTRAF